MNTENEHREWRTQTQTLKFYSLIGQVASLLGAQVQAKARGLSALPVSTAVRISQKMGESC